MNLPNDVSRCAGVLDWLHDPVPSCPHRFTCERNLQLKRDTKDVTAPVFLNCLVNGEYTMRIET